MCYDSGFNWIMICEKYCYLIIANNFVENRSINLENKLDFDFFLEYKSRIRGHTITFSVKYIQTNLYDT